MSPGARGAALEAGLAAVRARIAGAERAAGRPPGQVRLVVVTKFFPAADVRLLASLGVQDVGESRDQEAAPKAAACAGLPLRWHFVGQLQSNKARSAARYVDAVHSVDRSSLLTALGRAAQEAGREVGCFVQVRLEAGGRASPGEAGRGGAAPADVPALADAAAATEGVRLRGLMAVAPREEDPAAAFARLAALAERVRADHPGAAELSAGMSGDLEAAVAHGATLLRVGSAILGARPAAR
ncbi:YggS family pyridoxal phosphate-dependent enzyme [Kineococcus sp. NUM-3379]